MTGGETAQVENCELEPNRECHNSTRIALLENRVELLEEGQDREEAFRKTYYADREARIDRDARLDEKMNAMDRKLDGVKSWVDEQQDKPSKRWDAIVEKVVSLIVAALVGFVLAKIGL